MISGSIGTGNSMIYLWLYSLWIEFWVSGFLFRRTSPLKSGYNHSCGLLQKGWSSPWRPKRNYFSEGDCKRTQSHDLISSKHWLSGMIMRVLKIGFYLDFFIVLLSGNWMFFQLNFRTIFLPNTTAFQTFYNFLSSYFLYAYAFVISRISDRILVLFWDSRYCS